MSRYVGNNSFKANSTIRNQVVESLREDISRDFPAFGEWEYVYGFDHACGYFFQMFEKNPNAERDNIYEKDSLFYGLTGVELAKITTFVCNTDGLEIKDHIDRMYLDIPF